MMQDQDVPSEDRCQTVVSSLLFIAENVYCLLLQWCIVYCYG